MTMGEENNKEKYKLPIEKVQERMGSMPVVETSWNLSKDGKYVIQRTTISDIKPVNFVKAVLDKKPDK